MAFSRNLQKIVIIQELPWSCGTRKVSCREGYQRELPILVTSSFTLDCEIRHDTSCVSRKRNLLHNRADENNLSNCFLWTSFI